MDENELPETQIVQVVLNTTDNRPRLRVIVPLLGAIGVVGLALIWFVPASAPVILVLVLFHLYWSLLRRSRLSFHQGYFAGRKIMFQSLAEASRRGLEIGEWLQAEADRDAMYWVDNLASRRQKRQMREAVERAIKGSEDTG